MRFEITILGSRAAQPTVEHYQTAQVLNVHEQLYLLDCGEGAQRQIMRYGVHPMQINNVFLSHLHGDHCYGLFPMISTMGLQGRRTPLHIYAPAPIEAIVENHFKYFDAEIGYDVVCHTIDTTKHQLIYENKVLEVWSVPLRHRVACAGFLFREKQPPLNVRKSALDRYGLSIAQIVAAKQGEDITLEDGTTIANEEITYRPYEPRSYAYLSDTAYSAKAARLVKGCDVLFHEATYADADRKRARQTGHSTTLQAAKAAVEAGAKQLVIGHFSNRYDSTEMLQNEAATVFENTIAANEGTRITIPIIRNNEN